jgi:hypothetical protein
VSRSTWSTVYTICGVVYVVALAGIAAVTVAVLSGNEHLITAARKFVTGH